MFAPVVKSIHLGLSADAVAAAAVARGRATRSPPRRARSTSRSPPTCWPPTSARAAAAAARRTPDSHRSRRPAPLLDLAAVDRPRCSTRAERPLLWVGGGARDAGEAVARPRRAPRARRSSPPTARPASCRPAIPARSACRRTPRPRAASGTRPTSCSRSAPTSTASRPRTSPSRSRDTLIAVSLERAGQLSRRRRSLDGDAGEVTPRSLDASATATGSTRSAAPLRRPRRGVLRRSTRTALRFLDAIRFAVPADGVLVVDMCIPGYWLAGFHTPARPAPPAGPARLGHARLRVPGRARRGARGHRRPGRLDLRRRRLPVRVRRARDAWPRSRSR